MSRDLGGEVFDITTCSSRNGAEPRMEEKCGLAIQEPDSMSPVTSTLIVLIPGHDSNAGPRELDTGCRTQRRGAHTVIRELWREEGLGFLD
jgi:hypothetical protein